MESVKLIASGLQFPEGPVAMRDGSVIFAEIRSGAVRRAAPDGTLSLVAHCGGGPNGLAIGPDGALHVCNNGGNTYPPDQFVALGPAKDYAGGCIQRVDLATGEVRVLYRACGGNRLSSPNDLVFDAHGGFYFSDMGKRRARDRDHGALYYALPDGSSIAEVAFPIQAANGVGLSPDGQTVYVAETETSRLWAFDIIEPGRVKKYPFPSPHGGRLVCGLPGFQRFDSLAVDQQGNICVATLVTGHITVIAPSGAVVRQVKVPDTYVTNICFGGDDLRTAYMTLSGVGQLVSLPWPEAGLKLHFSA
ncbi:MAG: SMP-30/gluconolactonase/LRE family protein [candidate division NC10 bacterium]|nr:SMP-30/gluconolactonase/LRE family protein [candidate division NC10 bacterium]